MSKNRAIVLEEVDGFYHVLDSDGNFRRVRSRVKVKVGEEIEVAAFQLTRTAKVLLSIAATFLITILSTLGWTSWQTPVVVATISVDINPSLEIALDKEKHIVNVRAKNEDARKLLQGFNFKGQTLTEVLNQLVTRAVDLNFLNDERKLIVLGFSQGPEETLGCEESKESVKSEGKVAGQTGLAEVDSQALLSELDEVAASKDLDLEVVIFNLNSHEGSEAQKTGLSLGEYALWQTAEKAGLSVTRQTVKNSKERSDLIEVPAVQSQLKQNLHVIQSKNSDGLSKQETTKASRSQKERGKESSDLIEVHPVQTQLKQNLHVIQPKNSDGLSKQETTKASRSQKERGKESSDLIEVPAAQTQLKQNLHVIQSKISEGLSKQKTIKASRSHN